MPERCKKDDVIFRLVNKQLRCNEIDAGLQKNHPLTITAP
jgi:hypothetical protein